ELLRVDVFVKVLSAVAILFMGVALVGLAAGMGAQHPRFSFENVTQVSGSYGGIAFMIAAVLFILVQIGLLGWASSISLYYRYHGLVLPAWQLSKMGLAFAAALLLSGVTFWVPMRRGVQALEELAG